MHYNSGSSAVKYGFQGHSIVRSCSWGSGSFFCAHTKNYFEISTAYIANSHKSSSSQCTMSAPSKARLLQVAQSQAKIFHNITPTATPQRTGSKILQKPLKGEAIASYYGPKQFITTKQLNDRLPMYKFIDPEEEYRLDVLGSRKRRGKGAPQKKRSKAEETGKKKKK